MPEMIGDVIARWLQKVEGKPLPLDRESTVNTWLAEVVALVTCSGFSIDELFDEIDDDPQNWLGREYDQVRLKQTPPGSRGP